MNKLLTTLFALGVACVTSLAQAQAPAAAPAAQSASAAAPVQAAAPAKQMPAGAKSVEAKVAMCVGCHGIKGYQASFPEVYRVPMISGQSAKYIIAALNAYKAGDRKHPTMRGIAESLSDQDINDIANHYAAMGTEDVKPMAEKPNKEKPNKEPNAQVAALLTKAACASCHGANFSTPIDVYPKIAGQHKDYLYAALRAYKTENNPVMGRNNAVMGAIAKQFSNAELKALANYVASLDTELKTVPESRFR
jgi:cytochrome c553